jgi:hypothetical protein
MMEYVVFGVAMTPFIFLAIALIIECFQED